MTTIQALKAQIENANALGIANLAQKGVNLPITAATYEIMQGIVNIVSGGGGIQYTSITYNKDNTVILTDKDGTQHTLSCTYKDGKLASMNYDGKLINLEYNGDIPIKVGQTEIDLSNVPKTPATAIKVDGSVSEVLLPVCTDNIIAEINTMMRADSSASLEG